MKRTTQTTLLLALVSTLLLSLGALATVQAQDSDDAPPSDERRQVGGAGFFAIGTNVTDIGPLNDRLRAAGYPTFSSEMVSIGGGGYGVVANRFLLGGEGYGLLTGDAGYQGRTVSVGGGYGLFTLGYLAHAGPHLRAYPQIGLGGGGLRMEISSTGADDFDDVLDNPSRSASVGTASMVVSLGAGLEYHVRGHGEEAGFSIGLRAGYLFSTLRSDWQLDESSLSGGPDASMGGPFIRLILGGVGGDAEDDE